MITELWREWGAQKGRYVLMFKHGVAKLLESYSDLTSNNTQQYEFWHSSTNKSISYKYRYGRTYAKVAPWSDKFHGYPSPDQFVGNNIRAERSGIRVLAGARDLSRTS